jgi:hypothetical protein
VRAGKRVGIGLEIAAGRAELERVGRDIAVRDAHDR